MENLNWILQLLGRFHPLIVHFPIGLLVVAFFFELFTIGGKRTKLREGIYWMVTVGAFFAVLAALLGWFLKTQEDYAGTLVDNHQYTGIATAVLALITAFLLHRVQKGQTLSFTGYRIALSITFVVLSVAGHLGANLTHGEDYLSSVFENRKNSDLTGNGLVLLSELRSTDTITDIQQEKLSIETRAIFAHNCYQCHNENKQQGDLVLDSKEGIFKGGKSGKAVIPGKPEDSELYRRISLSPEDDEVMPKKGKVLKDNEIALVKLWIEKGAHWSDQEVKLFPEAPLYLTKPALPESNEEHPVDKIIDAYFESNNLTWNKEVDDRIFIKRVYMDILGLLPDYESVVQFRKDTDPNKREKLIDTLLADSHNYTQHWLSFWNDLLRNDYSGTGFITGGRKQITQWLYAALEQNRSYDQMVSELVNPVNGSEGFIKGIEWRGVVNSSQQTQMQAAQNIGQSLMGVNVKCASCHNSFVSNLTLEQAYGFATIFSDSILELNRCDKPIGKMAKANFIYPELGSVQGETVEERLYHLSQIIVKQENGRLYRTITNRFWDRLMGRGIVEPVDEMDNTPWNSVLLDWLASDFIESGYDLKHLMKRIMTSKVYQLPTVKYETQEAIKTNYVFQGPILRRLSAEQFSDAVSQVIAPLYHTLEYSPNQRKLEAQRIWHPEIKFDRNVLPEPGKRYFRKTFSLPNKAIKMANVLVSVDHSFQLYLNEMDIAQGADWKNVTKLDVTKFLKAGKNIIALEGLNEGSIANPAGLLFSMKISFENGEETIIHSNTSWKSYANSPEENWVSLAYDDAQWTKAHDYKHTNWGQLVDFTFDNRSENFARASLVKQNAFMKALGRPSRENVTTSRDDQATLLQALELTNGEFFNQILEDGAKTWLNQHQNNSKKIIETLYQKSLGRSPSKEEFKIMLAILGDQPQLEDVQDIFWSTLILPEFQFIY